MSEKSPTFAFVSLGCAKNLVDSERMLGVLTQKGYQPVPSPDGADFVVVNTCAFIESSRQESLAVIQEMTRRKERGEIKGVIITGCLAEREGPQLIQEIPLIDHAVGVFARDEIGAVADRLLAGLEEQRTVFKPATVQFLDDSARLRITPRHFAYLKISEGCDRACTFCAIPKMRGKHMTKPITKVVAEAEELARDGVRELIVVSQDTTYYGKDLYGETKLVDLLRRLDAVPGLEWIRILYAYPEYVTDELIDTMAQAQKIVPYLDMPLQHISNPVLKRMNRRHTREQTVAILDRLQDRWPDLQLRTTFIVGFPGETEEQFQELVDFVAEGRFRHVGVFTYSWEEGTPAVKLDGHVTEEIKQERQARLMLTQQQVALQKAQSMVGREVPVLVDSVHPKFPNRLLARGMADAPEIDTNTVILGAAAKPGQFLNVRITQAVDYDLRAEPVGSPW